MTGVGQDFTASRSPDIGDRGTATATCNAGTHGFNIAAQQVSSSSVSLRCTAESAYDPDDGNVILRKPSLRVETRTHDTGMNGTPEKQSSTATPCQTLMKPWLTASPHSHGTNGVTPHNGKSSSVHSEIGQQEEHDSVQGASPDPESCRAYTVLLNALESRRFARAIAPLARARLLAYEPYIRPLPFVQADIRLEPLVIMFLNSALSYYRTPELPCVLS